MKKLKQFKKLNRLLKTPKVKPVVKQWQPSSWRAKLETDDDFMAAQLPRYSDQALLERAEAQLAKLPPLVVASETQSLERALAQVCRGQAFILQAGECAEPFSYALEQSRTDSLRDYLKVFNQMSFILSYATQVPTVKIGRIAGQFAKPRSQALEQRGAQALPVFRGHIINDAAFEAKARQPDPRRLVAAYHQATASLNLLRAFNQADQPSVAQLSKWYQQLLSQPAGSGENEALIGQLLLSLRAVQAWGLEASFKQQQTAFYTSHEGLLLNWEEALTSQDPQTGAWYAGSAHMLWLGLRTNQVSGAQVEFMRGLSNPLGCKLGPASQPEEVLDLCQALNPDKIPGRLTFISRMGADKVSSTLTPILQAVKQSGHPVVWQCDPMHGNTQTTESGYKTRSFDKIMAEIDGYFQAHARVGTYPGGLHLELTGTDVTECVGGAVDLREADLAKNYQSLCDPRLNAQQSLELALLVGERLLDFNS